MVLIFLAVVFGVPIAQHVVEIRANLAKRAAWSPSSGEPKPGIAPKIYHVVELLPTREQIADAKGFWGYWSLIPSTESINEFEKGLKETSVLTESLLSPAQYVLTDYLGVGNEKAYVGRDGWLFYRPDVDYLTDDGFLTKKHLTAASHAQDIQPDPIKAILDFKRQLAARGITLVVMPMPTKPMIEPEKLVGPKATGMQLQNPSFGLFARTLETNGVPVYDPTTLLLESKKDAPEGVPQYLETDTHWNPVAMDAVAEDLAGFIGRRSPLPAPATAGYRLKPVRVTNLGDIAEMLKLPKGQDIFKPQTVETQQVLQSDGSLWQPRNDADVLLLGDSFSNIFSLEGMNWGKAAGFAEHLSYHLGRPVDSITKNAGGAFASRVQLAKFMKGEDRLAGKKVVVYEFSMRDLDQGDWKMITLPTPPAPQRAPIVIEKTHPPENTIKATPLVQKIENVSTGTIDPTKGQRVYVRMTSPRGIWKAEVTDADGKPVAEITKFNSTVSGVDPIAKVSFEWDGKGRDAKPVAPGPYKITVSIKRPEAKIEPVSADVTVTGPPAAGKFGVLGANPSTIDPTSKAKTKIEFLAPAPGRYSAEVRDGNGKLVRKLGGHDTKDGNLTFVWDGTDASGKPAADGKYAVKVKSDDKKSTVPPAQAPVTVKAKTAPVKAGPKNGEKPDKGAVKPAAESGDLIVTGTIVDRAKDPVPGQGPYKDALIELELNNVKAVSGTLKSNDILVYVWGMRDTKLVGGAFVKGATVTLKLIPWAKAGSVTSNNQISLENENVALDAYCGERK
jgi:alginate O-acetyltransferase complex protein AlgJ